MNNVRLCNPDPLKYGSNIFAASGSPIHPRTNEVMVIPNCVAERYAVEWRSISRAILACQFPLIANGSICVSRTLTMANSAATKNPFRKTKKRIIKTSMKYCPNPINNLSIVQVNIVDYVSCFKEEIESGKSTHPPNALHNYRSVIGALVPKSS